MREFGAESVLDLDAHNHYFWSNETLKDPLVALRSKSDKPSHRLPSLFLPYEGKLKMFVNTVTPQEYQAKTKEFHETDNVKIGLGLHPWYVEESDVDLFEELLPITRFIGEVGLDFSKKFSQEQKEQQVEAFTRICNVISDTFSQNEGKRENRIPLETRSFGSLRSPQDDVEGVILILSVHSCKTQGKTHEILKKTGVLENSIVIYHWFGDGPEMLKQAVKDGCLFSVNERMLSTKKGAELAKLIPEEQLLFETDLPKVKGDFLDTKIVQESIISAWQKWTKMANATLK